MHTKTIKKDLNFKESGKGIWEGLEKGNKKGNKGIML